MSMLVPNKAIDRTPMPATKAERALSWIVSLSLLPVVVLQMIGAVPLHAVHDAFFQTGVMWLDASGSAIDSGLDLFHGMVSAQVHQVANWAGSIPKGIAWGFYFGALTLFTASIIGTVSLGLQRSRKELLRDIGDLRSW